MARQPTLEQLLKARATIARVVRLHGPAYLPIFERLDREVAAAEKRDRALVRVDAVALQAMEEDLAIHVGERPAALPIGSVVYFARAGGLIKIGFTTDIRQRLRNLPLALRVPVRLLATVAGSIDDEALWHQHFAQLRATGELFRPEGELLAMLIRRIGAEAWTS